MFAKDQSGNISRIWNLGLRMWTFARQQYISFDPKFYSETLVPRLHIVSLYVA